jgi:hypothetical protein
LLVYEENGEKKVSGTIKSVMGVGLREKGRN